MCVEDDPDIEWKVKAVCLMKEKCIRDFLILTKVRTKVFDGQNTGCTVTLLPSVYAGSNSARIRYIANGTLPYAAHDRWLR